ncbi:chromosome partitioning protein ParA [Stutzerimonas azotifigens]|uniref:chromosome partitioning protein ParA n=1 Tax=Stutzerimonas azotifigens TaxID=291995 RepID=UPI0004174547|nr:chromosome partitioning protein ParA [Stutzerimonas azotifigens]
MQNKPQMVEAVLFFNERGICKEMLYPEFEALLDGVVSMPKFADQQMRVAYVLVDARLQVRAAVFFYLDFTEDGAADEGWNIPLRQLAERAGRGPDLGAGPIRLACRSQCPVAWHQMHLWDPEQTAGVSDLQLLRDTLRRNSLGLLVEEDGPKAVPADRLQVAAEDKWYPTAAPEAPAPQPTSPDHEQRLKAARLIKQQRLRIDSLAREHEAELAAAREAAEQVRQLQQAEIDRLVARIEALELHNARLQAETATQAERFQQQREELARQVRALERNSQAEADTLRQQLEAGMQAKIAAAVESYREQISIRDVELAYRDELDSQLQADIERLKKEAEERAVQAAEQALQGLAKQGVMFVAYHPGAGHLTIPPGDLATYSQNPQAYAAAKCNVSPEQYGQWLRHYERPLCVATLPSGEPCAMPIDRVGTPARFVPGESDCCSRHRTGHRLKTGS